jgi:hypothetical protein
MYEMSSVLPEWHRNRGIVEGFDIEPGARCMAVNADLEVFVRWLEMGSGGPIQVPP